MRGGGGGGSRGSNEPPLKINNGGRKSTMRRLSALVLMHIQYDMPVNLDEIVNLFEGLHPRCSLPAWCMTTAADRIAIRT